MRLTRFINKITSYTKNQGGRIKQWPWRKILGFNWLLPTLENIVDVVLKLGTLLLVSFFLIFFLRLFKDQGYVMEPFSVPQQLEESGFYGEVVALRLRDELSDLKAIVNSVKEDSLELKENHGDVNFSVLGVGLSLKNLAYQIRESLGRKNKVIKGEVTRIGNVYEIKIRMTDYPNIVKEIIVNDQTESEALDQLISTAAEGLLLNTDPYRLAIYCRNQKRFDEGIEAIRHLLRTNQNDAEWAYLAWGAILVDQGKTEEAGGKFQKSVEIDPNFSLGWIRLGWTLRALKKEKEAIQALIKVTELEPENCFRKTTLAWMYFRNKMYPEADSVFQLAYSQAKEGQQKIDVGMSWAESKLNQNDLVGAKKLIDNFDQDLGENPMTYLIKGLSAYIDKDTFWALKHLEDGFNLDPGLPYIVSSNIFCANDLGYFRHALDIFEKAQWDKIGSQQKQTLYNQCAMSYNMVGQHDSAYTIVQQAIDINPTVGYPYSTLGEVFYFKNELDSCFYFIEKSLALGMPIEFIENDSISPYDELSKMLVFQDLIRKYKRKTDQLAG